MKEDLLDAAQLSQEQGEGEARVHVEAEMDEQGEGDGGQMETEQAVESDRHEHAMAENCNDFLGSLRETSDTTPKSKTNEEADSSAVERMDEGHSLPENGSDAQADLQSTGKASCDVTDKSPVTTRKDGCDETPQTEVKEAINADCEGGETVATSSDSPHTKPDSTNFLSALNLLPRKRLSEELAEAEGSCSDNTKRPRTANQNGRRVFYSLNSSSSIRSSVLANLRLILLVFAQLCLS